MGWVGMQSDTHSAAFERAERDNHASNGWSHDDGGACAQRVVTSSCTMLIESVSREKVMSINGEWRRREACNDESAIITCDVNGTPPSPSLYSHNYILLLSHSLSVLFTITPLTLTPSGVLDSNPPSSFH